VVKIRPFEPSDLDQVVALSLRAWEPVFASLRDLLGDPLFLRLHPDWRADQTTVVEESCSREDLDVFIADSDGRVVGFVGVALNVHRTGMGEIEIIAVDADHQRLGIATQLTNHALGHMRQQGMNMAMVETGGDPGHGPARATYSATGFTLLPVARYFRLLGDEQ
jgi:GNAT superfamily N-acetyltransferase